MLYAESIGICKMLSKPFPSMQAQTLMLQLHYAWDLQGTYYQDIHKQLKQWVTHKANKYYHKIINLKKTKETS